MGKQLTSFEEILDPNFLNNELIGGLGAEKVLTITGFEEMEYYDQKTRKNQKGAAVQFAESLPLILNKTNTKTLKKLFNPDSDDTSPCIGHRIIAYVAETKVAGEVKRCVRIKEFSETKCEECGEVILPVAGKTVEQMLEISKRNTGKVLCLACMKKYKEEHT